MSELAAIDPSALTVLNDQLWRRLGITQTFDRLLVEATVINPGPVAGVRAGAGRGLLGGAAKFYEMTFPQLLRDLLKRSILKEAGGQLALDPLFADKLRKLVSDQLAGRSHVEPTPGVTVEDILVAQKDRAERDKIQKAAERRAAPKIAKGEKAEKAEKTEKAAKKAATPGKRASKKTSDDAAPVVQPPSTAPAMPATPGSGLITSQRVNKLVDVLDHGALNKDQLGPRLDLRGLDLERFLRITEADGITRLNGPNVELHWNGRELARTSGAERRSALRDRVKLLRDKAVEIDA